jgi:hypothetical protein
MGYSYSQPQQSRMPPTRESHRESQQPTQQPTQQPITRSMSQLLDIFRPELKVDDNNILYVKTVNYIRVIDMSKIIGIIFSSPEGKRSPSCRIVMIDKEGTEYDLYLLCAYETKDTPINIPSFTVTEQFILAQELTKRITVIFEKYRESYKLTPVLFLQTERHSEAGETCSGSTPPRDDAFPGIFSCP